MVKGQEPNSKSQIPKSKFQVLSFQVKPLGIWYFNSEAESLNLAQPFSDELQPNRPINPHLLYPYRD